MVTPGLRLQQNNSDIDSEILLTFLLRKYGLLIDPDYSYFFAASAGVCIYQSVVSATRYTSEKQPTTLWFSIFAALSGIHALFFIPVAQDSFMTLKTFAHWHIALGMLLFGTYIHCLKNFFMNKSRLLSWVVYSMFALMTLSIGVCAADTFIGDLSWGWALVFPDQPPYVGLGKPLAVLFSITRVITIFSLIYILAKGNTSRDRIIQAGIVFSIFAFLHSALTITLFPQHYLPLIPFMNLIEVARFGWLTLKKESLVLESYRGRVGHLETSLTSHVRLSKLGEKTASIIHDMSNPLTVIIGITYKLEKIARKKSDPELISTVDKLSRACEAASYLIQSGREAYRPSGKETGKVKISEVLEMTHDLMGTRCEAERIKCTIENETDVYVPGEIGDLTRVLVNLVNNACDAMINLSDEEKWINVRCEQGAGKLTLSIENGGPKISSDLADNIFTPFFSTKVKSGGTGLGLHVCRSLLENVGASLDLDQTSQHTNFVLTFPVHEIVQEAI